MTFAERLEELRKAATPGPWCVDPDDRPGMDWNNHIVQEGLPNTICFMAHDPRDNSGQQAAAELICFLANNADAILELVRAADEYLVAQSRYAKALLSAEIAVDNYSDSSVEMLQLTETMNKASIAEKRLHEALAKLNGEQT